MSEDKKKFEDKKRFVNIVKKQNNGVFALNISNALYGLKKPKILFSLVQPAPADAPNKSVVAKFFAGVDDALRLINRIQRAKPTEESLELFREYQGTKKEEKGKDGRSTEIIECRVMTVTVKLAKNKKGVLTAYYNFVVENCEGIQKKVQNGNGEYVDGVVSPKPNGKVFAKCSFNASRDEALYIADMLKMELQAWRSAINIEMLYHPDKYAYNSGNTQQGYGPRNAKSASQPPTAA